MGIKELIKKDLKLTQKKFAEELGVHENTVNNWCKGEIISLEGLGKIVAYWLNNNLPSDNLVEFLLEYLGVILSVKANKLDNCIK